MISTQRKAYNVKRTDKPTRLNGIKGSAVGIVVEGGSDRVRTCLLSPKGVCKCVLFFINLTQKFKAVTYGNRERNDFLVTRDGNSVIQFVHQQKDYTIMI